MNLRLKPKLKHNLKICLAFLFLIIFSIDLCAKPIKFMLSGGALFSKISSKTGFSGRFAGSYPLFPDLDLLADIDYLSQHPHHGLATDLQLGFNVPIIDRLKLHLGAGVAYLHLKNNTYPFSLSGGVSYNLGNNFAVDLYDMMRYKPGQGLLTHEVSLGVSFTFWHNQDNLIQKDEGALPYKHLQEKRNARIMALRQELCSDLSCDISKRVIFSNDLSLVKLHKSQLAHFLNLTNYNFKLNLPKNKNHNNKNLALRLAQAKQMKNYFVNHAGISQNRIRLV
jgi:hypothetical protein